MNDKIKAWKRACDKWSPSKLTSFSPINLIYAHVKLNATKTDEYRDGLLLATMLSEENHYLNTISLVHELRKDQNKLKRVLVETWSPINILDSLEDIYYISRGYFGMVFEAVDKHTKRKLAIKNIIPDHVSEYAHLHSLWKIFMERNILMSANDSPFMTRLFATFQDVNKKSFWILMEYCPCTLQKFVEVLTHSDPLSNCRKFVRGEGIILDIAVLASKKLEMNYFYLVFIYLFELLCALHYLADRHIVHADIKSDNILIATNGHAKLSDLGAAQRYRWVDKRSALYIIKDFDDLKETVEKIDFEFKRSGNIAYTDPETLVRLFQQLDKSEIRDIKKNFDLKNLLSDEKLTRQTFLTDFYAVGLIILEMLLGGVILSRFDYYSTQDLQKLGLNYVDVKFIALTFAYKEKLFMKVIYSNLLQSFDERFHEFVFLLARSLQRRSVRGKGISRNIEIYRNYQIENEPAIDIKLIEQMQFYQRKQINSENVSGLMLPQNILDFCISYRDKEPVDIKNLTIDTPGISLPTSDYRYKFMDL